MEANGLQLLNYHFIHAWWVLWTLIIRQLDTLRRAHFVLVRADDPFQSAESTRVTLLEENKILVD